MAKRKRRKVSRKQPVVTIVGVGSECYEIRLLGPENKDWPWIWTPVLKSSHALYIGKEAAMADAQRWSRALGGVKVVEESR